MATVTHSLSNVAANILSAIIEWALQVFIIYAEGISS